MTEKLEFGSFEFWKAFYVELIKQMGGTVLEVDEKNNKITALTCKGRRFEQPIQYDMPN